MKNLRISKKFLAIVTACLSLSVFSCKDELSDLDNPPNGGALYKNVSVEEQDKARIEVAKVLAKSLAENVALRKYMKTEAMKQFDNDSDILWAKSKNDFVDGQKTFKQILNETSSNIDDISAKLPLLNFLFPWIKDHSVVDWNTDSEIPLVVVLGSKQLNNDNKTLIAYDAEGNEHILDAFKHPNQFVIVVEDSERIEVVGNVPNGRTKGEEGWIPCIQSGGTQYFYRDESYNNRKYNNARIDSWSDKIPYSGNLSFPEYYPNEPIAPYYDDIFNRVPEWLVNQLSPNKFNREAIYFKNNGSFNHQVKDRIQYIRLRDQATASDVSETWAEGNLEFEVTRILGGKTTNDFNSLTSRGTVEAQFSFKGASPHFIWQGNLWTSLQKLQQDTQNGQVYGNNIYFGTQEWTPGNGAFQGNWFYLGESGFQWSLFRYGDAVKYVIIEHDNGEVTKTTHSHTTNFNASLGQTGFMADPFFFNVGTSFSTTSTQEVTSTNNSDPLAEFIVYYTDKVGFVKPDGPYSSGAVEIICQTK
jgi:hypothetical protein